MKLTLIFVAFATTLWPQAAAQANKGYKTKEGRADVIKMLGAEERHVRMKPAELVAALEIRPGMTVADIGTGIGFMLPHLSKAAGPGGKVYAQDIQTDFLDRAKEKKLPNVEYFLGTETDPKLPPNSVDVMLLLDTYHHFDYPEKMLANMKASLRAGGKLVIVDFYRHAGPGPEHVRIDRDGVIKEVTAAGFELAGERDHIPNNQFMLTFRKR